MHYPTTLHRLREVLNYASSRTSIDATIVTAIIGAIATIITAVIGAAASRAKDRTNAQLKREWEEYKSAVSQQESYLDVDYGVKIISPIDNG